MVPPELAETFQVRFAAWRPSVWVARHMIRPLVGRVVPLRVEDGVRAGTQLYGQLLDVHRDGQDEFHLLVRGLLPHRESFIRRRQEGAYRQAKIPLRLVTELPEGLRFLASAPETWDMPPSRVPCPRCDQHIMGRFCTACGTLSRRGRDARWPGPAFSVLQAVLRDAAGHSDVHPCSCGGYRHASHAHCMKCGSAPVRP